LTQGRPRCHRFDPTAFFDLDQPERSPMTHCKPLYRMIAAGFAIFLGGIQPAGALAQVSAEQSARQIKPAPGLEARLWASEPMLVNPTNIDVDSRGRVWVAEGLNYRLSRGGNRRFHRIEEADRIKILEDTDADGKADKVTVFADKIFPVPMGIAIEEHYSQDGKYQGCRVFIGNSPDLLVLEDVDGDDKADKRYPLLTGFGGIDSDHGVHGMVLALDGKLYFTHGDGCCSVQHDHSERQQNFDVIDKSGRHVYTDQLANTLRVNRDGTQFEIICDRQRNNYETCLSSFGNIFTSDNDDDGNRGCRVIWAMDGGHYGYHTPGSPRHWGEEVPGNVPKLVGTGNGSPCGIMLYEGELLPAEYQGGLFEIDAGTRQVNFFPLTRKGAAFRTEYKVFLRGDDPWFRPVDACSAPDGSVFVADWYDAGVGGHAFSDQTTGRIYRVSPQGHASRKTKVDFSTVDGLVAALQSPNIATHDAARRLLVDQVKLQPSKTPGEPATIDDARGRQILDALGDLASSDHKAHIRARAIWTYHGITAAAGVGDALVEAVLKDDDPRLRELAVRILGRDCRENGKVEYNNPQAKQPPPVLAHQDALLPIAHDPDAGVRRELILALRNLPTEKARSALKALAAAWDGQDRWYLEALGLALDHRESQFLATLFDGDLYGDLHLEQAAKDGNVALPPYFPVDRNEAFISAGTPDRRVSSISKYVGLAWRLHRPEVLPLLERLLPSVRAIELQQAADDVLGRIDDPKAASLAANMALQTADRARQQALLQMLAQRLAGAWSEARGDAKVLAAIERTLADPQLRKQGIALAAATHDTRHRASFERLAEDTAVPEDIRVAAIEGLGSFPGTTDRVLDQLIASAKGSRSSNALAEAAIRTIARLHDVRGRLADLVTSSEYPLGLRREALRTLVQLQDGGMRVLAIARAGKLPGDLKSDATTWLHTDSDRRVRTQAAEILPLPQTAAGQALPPIRDLMHRQGDAEKGRAVFFRTGTNSCASCHRVQGRGQWIGPDLSTIGVKYGRDEIIRSILSPSAAIGYSFRSLVLSVADGRVLTGLPVEETPDRLVIKTAEGQRIAVDPRTIDERRNSDVSLMPEGLAQTLSVQEFVNLLEYLDTLRRPVSIVGEYHVIGPVRESNGTHAVDPAAKPDLGRAVDDGQGHRLSWRKVATTAEGQADLVSLAGNDREQVAYAFVPLVSPVGQEAQLVIDTQAEVTAWLDGKAVPLSAQSQDKNEPQTVNVELPQGSSALLIRFGGKSTAQASVVTTLVSDQPVGFDVGAAGRASSEPRR
jgi:putative membrane-bound dehydrogenase-like protein